MQFNVFGKTGRKVSRVGLGCWQLGGNWGHVDDATAKGILKATIESGVTFLDTADVYGDGRSERLIGDFLDDTGLQDHIFVATKLGRGGDLMPDNFTRENVTASVEASLKRLKTEALDLVQLHCIPAAVLKGPEIWDILDSLVAAGKIKSYGASVESMEEALICVDQAPSLTSLQVIFNLFRQKPVHLLFETAKEKKIGIIARVPLASGALTGRFKTDTSFGESDHRNFNKDGEAFNVGETFAGLPFEKAVELANELKAFVPLGYGLTQFALRWILDFDAVSVVIPGASTPEQAKRNAEVTQYPPLPLDLHHRLRTFYEASIRNHIRGPY